MIEAPAAGKPRLKLPAHSVQAAEQPARPGDAWAARAAGSRGTPIVTSLCPPSPSLSSAGTGTRCQGNFILSF